MDFIVVAFVCRLSFFCEYCAYKAHGRSGIDKMISVCVCMRFIVFRLLLSIDGLVLLKHCGDRTGVANDVYCEAESSSWL